MPIEDGWSYENTLVGEFMVVFLLVFIELRTAVNSDFVYSSMACFADARLQGRTSRIVYCLQRDGESGFGLRANIVEKSQRPERLQIFLCPFGLDNIRHPYQHNGELHVVRRRVARSCCTGEKSCGPCR